MRVFFCKVCNCFEQFSNKQLKIVLSLAIEKKKITVRLFVMLRDPYYMEQFSFVYASISSLRYIKLRIAALCHVALLNISSRNIEFRINNVLTIVM